MEKITFCIPSKNNLRYLKSSIQSIKRNGVIEHDIIVYVDMSNDGTEDWLIENNIKYLKNDSNVAKGIAYGYNRCIESATTNIVCMFHADMYMGIGFDINILKHLIPGTVVAGTRIEPPLHPEGKEKIVMDFGMYPEDFDIKAFDAFVKKSKMLYENVTTRGIFAPWAIFKSDITHIGLHDEEFHSYYEDSDIFNRMILSDYKILQSRDAFVYHLTCRGGQFQDGIEKITTDPAFHNMKDLAAKHYIRKWGSWIRNDEYQHPVIIPKYNVGIQVTHCNLELLTALEPWCDRIYIDDEMQVLTTHYMDSEQPNTSFDLTKRVMTTPYSNPHEYDDVVVELDRHTFTQQDFGYIQQLAEIIQSSGEPGEFRLGNLKITIYRIKSREKDLIVCE